MTTRTSSMRADIDLEAPGKRVGHVRLPHSVHESAYGWIPIPTAVVRGGEGPAVLLTAGNHGDEYEGRSRCSSWSANSTPRGCAAASSSSRA